MLESLAKKVIREMPKYITGESIESVREKYDLKEVFKLASNENQLGTSPKALSAMIKCLTSVNQYPDGDGKYLRRRLAQYYKDKYNINLSTNNFLITMGASGMLNLLGEVFICPGDEVIYSELSYPAYSVVTKRNEGISVEVPINEDLTIDLDAIVDAITDKTKIIFVCNPNNPTGTIVCKNKLKEFINKVPKNIIVVIDEAYFEFINKLDYPSAIYSINENNNLVVLRTFSKIYGLAGMRVGYGIMSEEINDILMKASNFFCTNRPALEAAIAALDDEEFYNKTFKVINEGRKYLTDEFNKLEFKVYNSQTNFMYVDTGMDTYLLAQKLKEYGIIIRQNFPLSRITIGTSYQNQKMIIAIKDIIKNRKVPKSNSTNML